MKMRHLITTAVAGILILGCENREQNSPAATTKAPEKLTEAVLTVERAAEARPPFMATTPLELGGQCNMETINWRPWTTTVRVDRSFPILEIAGWAADVIAQKTPTQTYLRLQDPSGKEFYGKTEQTNRKDVADYFKKEFYEKSGYKIKVDLQDVPNAVYDVVVVMESGGKSILCSSGQKLVLESKN